MTRSFLAALALTTAAACSDPYEPAYGDSPCQDGMVLDGAACAAPNRKVTIDGAFDDWQGMTLLTAPTSGYGLNLARDGEAGILVRVITTARPDTSGQTIYDIQLVGDTYVVHVGVGVNGDGWFYQEGSVDTMLGSTPAVAAFGVDGFELRIPVDQIPLAGQANVDVVACTRAKDESFACGTASQMLGPIDCWDPHIRFNKCSHE
jgi:hypothetical protein